MARFREWVGAAGAATLVAMMFVTTIGRVSARSDGGIGADRFKALDDYLAGAREEMGIPGLALVVVQGDQLTHVTAIGLADASGRQITPQTPFLLASTSKAFTALAVMQQVEAGRVELDATVQRYLPWFTLADPAAAAQIKVRQLLDHTSGLSPTSGQAYHDSDDQDVGALERVVRGLAASNLVAPPGTGYHYSNTNYDILGLIVQTVSGEPFGQYIEERVFAPLDMRHSHATLQAAQADGLAAGYYHWFGLAWQPAAIPMPAAGAPSATMYVSAEDLGHELIAHLNGGLYGSRRILSAAGVTTLHAAAVRIDDFHGYAMGWDVRPLWEALDPTVPNAAEGYQLPALVEHDGVWANGHSYVGMVPAEGWGFALLVNAWDFAEASRFGLLEQNVLRVLEGHEPLAWTATEEPLAQNGRLLATGLLVAELVSFALSIRWFRAPRGHGVGAGRRRLLLAAVLALGLDLLVAWLYLVYAPAHFETTVTALLRESPDIALVGLPALALAVIWGPIRTILLARILLTRPTRFAPTLDTAS